MLIEKQQLAELEKSGTHQRWQQEQEALQVQEQQLNTVELSLRAARQQLTDWETRGISPPKRLISGKYACKNCAPIKQRC
ncbi:MAG: hypothetical protein HC935_06520 [Pseudanabaena sp. SU_2_4]|nr:hypothetical protein [Pseudanabaena sp. SU_2_4]